jgi:hypothetical protein
MWCSLAFLAVNPARSRRGIARWLPGLILLAQIGDAAGIGMTRATLDGFADAAQLVNDAGHGERRQRTTERPEEYVKVPREKNKACCHQIEDADDDPKGFHG